MKQAVIFTSFLAILLGANRSHAADCWTVTNIKGYSAMAEENYKFAQDGFRNPMQVCFTSDGGTVSCTDIQLLKFGTSTLAGYGRNELGNEIFEVYQLDRETRKLLFVKSRVGPEKSPSPLPNIAAAYVGDAARVAN
ncbi:MAG: hypothetical protein ACREPG_05225 [Candidatus Binatia bacterium]